MSGGIGWTLCNGWWNRGLCVMGGGIGDFM